MRKLLCVGVLLISPLWLRAQLNNQSFENRMQTAPEDSSKIFLGLNFLGFGKNNEYFSTTIDGYTLFGYQVNPWISYQLAPHVRLDAGVYAQKDFGNEEYSSVLPTLSLKVQKRNVGFVFGTLEGSLNHRLIEPLYDFERVLNNRIENGGQVLWMKDGIFLDVWVDWTKMIYFNDPEQERFTAGGSFQGTILRKGNFTLDIPLQIVFTHRGGQIDQNPDPVVTTTNAAGGLHADQKTSGWINAVGVKSYLVGYRSTAASSFFKDGGGVFVNPYVTTSFGLTVMGSYWNGGEYLANTGGVLYTARTEQNPERVDRMREWFMLRLLYDVKVAEGLNFTLRAEPFYDTYAEAIQYSYGFYLNLNTRFFLAHAPR
jgi:hypothetical protein